MQHHASWLAGVFTDRFVLPEADVFPAGARVLHAQDEPSDNEFWGFGFRRRARTGLVGPAPRREKQGLCSEQVPRAARVLPGNVMFSMSM